MPIIAIDGVDGSGKETQSKLLFQKLQDKGLNPLMMSFPDYKSESSALVRMYLNGDFGASASDVNAKTASTFFALDRFASYRRSWKTAHDEGRIIIADRYTTSNMIHQASKIADTQEKDEFLDWLCDFEYNILGLPKPDSVIFLDMPPEYGAKHCKDRANKADGSDAKDIHERDTAYIADSYNNAKYIAAKYGWHTINCIDTGKNDVIRTIADISGEVYELVLCKLGYTNG